MATKSVFSLLDAAFTHGVSTFARLIISVETAQQLVEGMQPT